MPEPIAVDLLRHNLWANQRLLTACRDLTPVQLALSAPGTYGPVGDTLVHMLAAEGRYAAEFTKVEPDIPLQEGEPFPAFDLLLKRAYMSGEALAGIAGEPDRMLHGTYRGRPYEMRGAFLLAQAINHATEHRSHVVSILNQNGIKTPRLDAIAYFAEVGNG